MLTLYKETEDMEAGAALAPESTFRFRCHPGVACFNRCCQEATIILSPYDILRLSRNLGLTTGEFLRRYTSREPEDRSHLPLVLVKHSRRDGCPFLGAEGCTVYADRPAACRLFPLAQGSELTPSGVVDHYFLRRLEYCQGWAEDGAWTVAAWQADQGFPAFDGPRRAWLELLLRQGQPGLTHPDDRILSQFYLVAYDLDGFRTFLCESAFLRRHGLEAEAAAPLKTDNLALLRFSASYLEQLLFPEEAAALTEVIQTVLSGSSLGKTA